MALFEGKTPAERNKLIAAIALPLLALIFVLRMFSGPSGPSADASRNANADRARRAGNAQRTPMPGEAPRTQSPDELFGMISTIECCPTPFAGAEAGRNIFAFYVKPAAPPTPVAVPTEPTPPPPPPLILASLTPQSVFARTAGFTLQVSGDKFGPAARVYVDGQELKTEYRSMQQLNATVPASVIASPGQRQVMVRTPDGQLYSNTGQLTVMQPPSPTYTYVGFLKRQRANTAVLKDGRGELYSVREGDLVEGRFRVTVISERGVEVVDKDLNIKHTMAYIAQAGGPGAAPPGRAPGTIQPPPPAEEDEEP